MIFDHLLCLFETERCSGHVNDPGFMSQAVHQSIYQDLVGDKFIPPAEGEICGDDSGVCLRSERQMVEEQFGTFLVAGDVSELVADYQIIFLEAVLYPGQLMLALCLADSG